MKHGRKRGWERRKRKQEEGQQWFNVTRRFGRIQRMREKTAWHWAERKRPLTAESSITQDMEMYVCTAVWPTAHAHTGPNLHTVTRKSAFYSFYVIQCNQALNHVEIMLRVEYLHCLCDYFDVNVALYSQDLHINRLPQLTLCNQAGSMWIHLQDVFVNMIYESKQQ